MADNTPEQATRSGSSANEQELNPKTQHYEFLGPIGALGFVTVLPLLVLFFATCCGPSGYPSQDLVNDWRGFLADLTSREHLLSMLDWKAMAVYLAFVVVLAVFANVLSGDVIPGTTLRNGQRLKYRLNGKPSSHSCQSLAHISIAFASFYNIFLLLIALLAHLKLGLSPLTFVYDHWVGLVTASILFSYLISLAVYIKSFQPSALLALGGNTGNALYDYMIGRELNPRIGEFDIKFFTELRPGLIGWVMIDVCFAVKQYLDLGRVTNSMGLVLFFHTWYVADALWNEEACLTTMDITTGKDMGSQQ